MWANVCISTNKQNEIPVVPPENETNKQEIIWRKKKMTIDEMIEIFLFCCFVSISLDFWTDRFNFIHLSIYVDEKKSEIE